MKTALILTTVLIIGFIFSSCKKYLDEKPDKSLVVPQTVKDLQAILDNTLTDNASYPYALDIGVDDYYLNTSDWQSRPASEKNAYVWSAEVFAEHGNHPWAAAYSIVYNCNIALDRFNEVKDKIASNPNATNIKGQALFTRSFAFFTLLQVFAKPYSTDSADIDPGIALRLDADLNKPTLRATVKECYKQIINDAKEAALLLPPGQVFKTRPCKAAAYALLARTYLSMRDYDSALQYADSSLMLNSILLDYNTLNVTMSYPVPLFNDETLFHSIYSTTLTLNLYAKTDSSLYNSYAPNDLRKTIFFKSNPDGSHAFKGSYDGSIRLFNGFAIDEMYLTRAECYARKGNVSSAMNDLNALLSKRWKAGTFTAFTAIDANDALAQILEERRKELLMRGIRWTDLRRLNKEPQFQKTLVRDIGGSKYYLYPNDKRYVFPIPSEIIEITGIEQNP